MRYSAGGVVSGSGDGPVRIGHRGWQRPHHGIAVAVAIGYRCSGSIRDRGQAVAAAAIGRSGLDGLPARTGQGGSGHIAGAVVTHCLSDLPIGDGFQPVGIGSQSELQTKTGSPHRRPSGSCIPAYCRGHFP